MGVFERVFEATLWNSRFFVFLAVVGSMLAAIGLFYITAVDVYYTLVDVLHYATLDDVARAELRADTVAHVVGSVDGFLLAIVMLIFCFGIYELFISDIDCAKNNQSSKILIITSLDDLKARLSSVILMILVVLFFQHAIHIKPHGVEELLSYGAGIALVALSLYLLHKSHRHEESGGHGHDNGSHSVDDATPHNDHH